MKNFFSKTAKDARIHTIFASIALFITGILCMSQSINAQSALDGFNPNANGRISAIVVQPDGKIIVGGDFNTIQGMPRNYLARLYPDGTLDQSFNPNPDYSVLALALQPDGKIIAGGNFTSVSPNGGAPVTRVGIARFKTNGTLDTAFDPNPDNTVSSIVIQPNGKILAGGIFTSVAPNGGAVVTRNRIARLETDGTLDAAFDPNADDVIYGVALQTDGRIIIAGNFNTLTPNGGTFYNQRRIARLNADGTLDATVNLSVDGPAFELAIQADGKFIVGGLFNNILTNNSPTAARKSLARFNADGTLDTTFNVGMNYPVSTLAIQPDGRIIAGGSFTTVTQNGGSTVTRNGIARINPNGSLDTAFNPNISYQVSAVVPQSDGKILVGGSFSTVGTTYRNNIARLEGTGQLEIALNLSVNGAVYTTATLPDGKILIGGDFTSINGTTRNRFARLNSDGSLDALFNPNVNGTVYTIAIQPDGKFLIGGDFTTVGGTMRNRVARFTASGIFEFSFNPNADNSVRALATQPDGKILVGGLFINIGGQMRKYLVRLNADGTNDYTFYPNPNNNVYAITVQPNGKILTGGDFTNIGGVPRNYIARLNADGSNDQLMSQSINGSVTALAVQSDGKILLGGNFTYVGGQTRVRIARLDAVGQADPEFNANLNAAPNSIVVQSDGLVLVGGAFTNVNGQPRSFLARLTFNGGVDNSFNPNVNAAVRTIAAQSDGKIFIGGSFTNAGGQTRYNFARLTNTAAALSALDITPTAILLTRDGAAAQFSRVVFEQSIDNGTNWTTLGTATDSMNSSIVNDRNDASTYPFTPTSIGYSLSGQNIPTGQNVLIRARGFYRTGDRNGSETVEDKVQNVFLSAPIAGKATVSGVVVTPYGAGLRNVPVKMTFANGETVTKTTSAFGYFRFDEIAVGQTVTISIAAKNYSSPSQTVNVDDNISGLTFVSN